MSSPFIPPEEAQAELRALLLQNPSQPERALEFYDSLPAVAVEQLHGAWAGRELPTGNPLGGLLRASGWHGKRFDGPDAAHPLVMDGRRDQFSLNPAVVPIGTVVRLPALFRRPAVSRIVRRVLPLLATRKPTARLRTVEYRGVPTATMIYDALPINDHFRRINRHTVLGAMDLRGMDSPLMFILERDPLRP